MRLRSMYRMRYMERSRIRDVEDIWMQALCDALGCTVGDLLYPEIKEK